MLSVCHPVLSVLFAVAQVSMVLVCTGKCPNVSGRRGGW